MIKSQTTFVQSSTIDSLHYDAVAKRLMVTFLHGATYTYFDVTLEDYHELITSSSVGKALNSVIKTKYQYVKHDEL